MMTLRPSGVSHHWANLVERRAGVGRHRSEGLPIVAGVAMRKPVSVYGGARQSDAVYARLGRPGFFIPQAYDLVETSYHILTVDGCRGRDTGRQRETKHPSSEVMRW